MEKLTKFAGSVCFIVIVLLIRCPSLRPDLTPVIHRVGAAFDLYPKSEMAEVNKPNLPFEFKLAPGKDTLRGLLNK